MKMSRDFFMFFVIIFISLDIALTSYFSSNIESPKVRLAIIIMNILAITFVILITMKFKRQNKSDKVD